jgi:hypothetical protein
MKVRQIVPIFFLCIFPTIVIAMTVNVEIEGISNGRNSFFDFNNSSILSFKFDWENIGSVDCNTMLRIDIIDNSSKAYTAWSDEYALAPGGGKLFEVYYIPKESGNYTAEMNLYYCNEILPLTSFNFSFIKPELKDLDILIETSSNENEIYFVFESDRDLDELIVIPKEFPKGWIFNSIRLDGLVSGEKRAVSMDYKSAVWRPRNITFAVFSDGGYQEFSVELKKKEESIFDFFYLAIFLLSISIILNFYLLLKRTKKKRK